MTENARIEGRDSSNLSHRQASLDSLVACLKNAAKEVYRDRKMLRLNPSAGTGAPTEIARWFGGPNGYSSAVHVLEAELYAPIV